MAKLEGLIKQLTAAEKDLVAANKQLGEAEAAFRREETDSLVEERPPSEKFKRKLADATEKQAAISSRLAALNRAITEVRDQDFRERDQREYEAREAFRKKASPALKRLDKAIYEIRNAAQGFFELAEAEKFEAVSLDAFLWPPEPNSQTSPFEGMAQRFARLQILNGAVAMISDDLQHSRFGPQQPKETR